MIMLAALGMFVFGLRTVPFQSLDRSQSWRHPHQSVVGAAPPAQFTGADPEEITVNAELRPEVTGGAAGVEVLRSMAATGEPYPLIMGNGKVMGSYVIVSISENSSELNEDGSARSIAFAMQLKKVADSALGQKGEALQIGVSLVRSVAGI